jgi:hypothetical protein
MPSFGAIGEAPISAVPDIVEVITSAPDPIAKGEAFLTAVRQGNNGSGAWREWIPNTPEKVAAYVVTVVTVLELFKSAPQRKIEINQTFHQQYELIIQHPERFGIDDLIGPRVKRL